MEERREGRRMNVRRVGGWKRVRKVGMYKYREGEVKENANL